MTHHSVLYVFYLSVSVGDMRTWYTAFRRRHPQLSQRTTRHVDKKRIDAQNNKAAIAHYFKLLEPLKDLEPSSIFAADETGLDGDGARYKKVLAPKGVKRVHSRGESYAEHTSLMSICCANGESAPPCYAFKGAEGKVNPRIVQQLPLDSRYVQQPNGYFLKTHFKTVLQHLLSFASKFGSIGRRMLFIIDGAKSHVDLEALEFAVQNNIHIICIPAHTSHVLQVADLALFGPFKKYWKAVCRRTREERQRTNVREKKLTRMDIVPLSREAWAAAMTNSNIKSAFHKAGIYPYDPKAYLSNKSQTPEKGQTTTCLAMIHAAIKAHPAIADEPETIPSAVRCLLPVLNPPRPDMPADVMEKCTACGTDLKKEAISTAGEH